MKKFYGMMISLLFVLFVTSCGTLTHGSTEYVKFNSSPSGAIILVNDIEIGKTPLTSQIKSNKAPRIEFKLDSIISKLYYIDNHCRADFVICDIILGLIPVIVDVATQDWNTLNHNDIFYDFKEKNITKKLDDTLDFINLNSRNRQMYGVK
jgi:hypothetical protein